MPLHDAMIEFCMRMHDRHIRVVKLHLLQVSITPLGVFGGWLTATPSTGVIKAQSQQAVQLVYDVSQNEFQGTYQAQLLLTTTARPVAKASKTPF